MTLKLNEDEIRSAVALFLAQTLLEEVDNIFLNPEDFQIVVTDDDSEGDAELDAVTVTVHVGLPTIVLAPKPASPNP